MFLTFFSRNKKKFYEDLLNLFLFFKDDLVIFLSFLDHKSSYQILA